MIDQDNLNSKGIDQSPLGDVEGDSFLSSQVPGVDDGYEPTLNEFNPDAFSQNLISPTDIGMRTSATYSRDQEAGFLDVPGAVFRDGNSLFAAWNDFNSIRRQDLDADEEFDYDQLMSPSLEEFRPQLSGARNMDEFDYIAQQSNREMRDKEIMSQRPMSSFLFGAAEFPLDPISYLPLGKIFSDVKKGEGVLKSMANAAAASAVGTYASEELLRDMQVARTKEESKTNLYASAILGAGLGGAAHLIAPIFRRVHTDTKNTLDGSFLEQNESVLAQKGKDGDFSSEDYANHAGKSIVDVDELAREPFANTLPEGNLDSVGAARAAPTSEEIAGFGAKLLADITSVFNPILRLSASKSPTSKVSSEIIFNTNLTKEKNLVKNGASESYQGLEVDIKNTYGTVSNTMSQVQDIFFDMHGINPEGYYKGTQMTFKADPSLPKRGEYNKLVSEAVRNGGKSHNEHVAKAANKIINDVLKPIEKRLIALNMLPENVSVKTASQYLMRTYNLTHILEHPDDFYAVAKNWFETYNNKRIELDPQIVDGQAKIKSLEKKFKSKKTTPAQKELIKGEIEKSQQELKDLVGLELVDSDGNIRPILDETSLEETINQTKDNILSRSDEKLRASAHGNPQQGGPNPLKPRSWNITDAELSNKNLIINDIEEIMDMYTRNIVPHIAAAEKAKEIGVLSKHQEVLKTLQSELMDNEFALKEAKPGKRGDFESKIELLKEKIEQQEKFLKSPEAYDLKLHLLEGVDADYKLMEGDSIRELNNLDVTAKEKGWSAKRKVKEEKKIRASLTKLNDRRMRDQQDIVNGVDLVMNKYRGTFDRSHSKWAQFAHDLRKWVSASKMGSVVLSSITDMASMMARGGYLGTIRTGLATKIRGDMAQVKNKQLLASMGYAINRFNGSRIKNLLDIEGTSTKPNMFSRGGDYVSNAVFNAQGFNLYMDAMQEISGNTVISKLFHTIDQIANKAKVADEDLTYLVRSGITKDDAAALHNLWKKSGGKTKDGAYYIDHLTWNLDDPKTAKAYKRLTGAIRKNVDEMVVEPSPGDVPHAFNSQIGKMMLQFKRFAFSSHNKLLISQLSAPEVNFMGSVMTASAFGAMGYMATSFFRDGGETLDLSAKHLSLEMIDRSGMFAMLLEGVNIAGKITGLGNSSRYQSRNLASSVIGPSFGAVQDLVTVINKITGQALGDTMISKEERFTTGDAKKILRMLPLQNVFFLTYLNRKIMEESSAALGARRT